MTTASPPPDPRATAADAASVPAVPDHEVLRRIGRGAYGEIWLARARATGAWRAVKIVRREGFDDERAFRREFEGLAAFEPISRSHDGFVDILQVGRADDRGGFLYYVMELADDLRAVPGAAGGRFDPDAYRPRTLRAELGARGGRLPAGECVELGLRLGEALGALHSHGLSHRDLKPENVIFVGGRPMLADIGLVAAHGQRSFVGTEGYVPPEGAGGAAADVYALGKVVYESSMGRDRLDFPALGSQLGNGEEDDGADRRRLRGLNAVVLRACAARPADRYGSAEAFCADLRRLQAGKGPRRRWQRKHAAAGWIVGIALLAAGAAALLFRADDHRRVTPAPARVPDPVARAAQPFDSPTPEPRLPIPPPPAAAPTSIEVGRVALESEPPGALVRLGERELGETPLTIPDLPPGPAAFTLVLPGYRHAVQEVTVIAGGTVSVRVPLEPGRWPVAGKGWENGLGMRLVPLEPGGTVLMSVWETRVRDFAAFVEATGYDAVSGGMATLELPGNGRPPPPAGASWREPGFTQTPEHPVVGVSWKDAFAFCDWLTVAERDAGRLDANQFYRLPTDAEWSRAVGLPPEAGATPQARSGRVRGMYPWGTAWPPPPGAGNYAGAELRAPGAEWPAGWRTLPTADNFPRTAPAGSFRPNALGIYDLGGNVWEWCEDRFGTGAETRVLRGGAWANVDAELLLSSKRIEAFPHSRSDLYGFRVVLEAPALGRVEITSEPPGATVFQGERALGQTPLTLPAAAAGDVSFTLRLDGFVPAPLTGRVDANGRLRLHSTLRPADYPRAGQPWENGLGMRFAPVGERLLFSVWETRVADFGAFCRETGRAQPVTDFEQGATHPVVNVNRDDAEAFCAWLTTRERTAGRLRAGQRYRLPTDREWSLAAGMPEEPGETPEARDGRLRGVYPWGKTWPPPPGAGNFAESGNNRVKPRRRLTPTGEAWTQTSPAGSFAPNALGLYDVAGNVWEWCADAYKTHGALRQWGVLRGGSWADFGPGILLSSYRNVVPAGERDVIYGFRCVLEPAGAAGP